MVTNEWQRLLMHAHLDMVFSQQFFENRPKSWCILAYVIRVSNGNCTKRFREMCPHTEVVVQ